MKNLDDAPVPGGDEVLVAGRARQDLGPLRPRQWGNHF